MAARLVPSLSLPIAVSMLIVAGFCPAGAQDGGRPKPAASTMYERLAGNTLTGRTSQGNNSTEYHSPDGRVFGFNWGRPNLNACWRTNGPGIVCYYYNDRQNGGHEACWRFEPVEDHGYKIHSLDSDTTGIYRIEPGNPHDLNDQGQSWTCDALMVAIPSPLSVAVNSRRDHP